MEETRRRDPVIVKCKYDSEREVPLYTGAARLLGRRREATGFVFVNPRTGEPWRETQPAAQFLGPAYERAGLRRAGRVWRLLRHTYASTVAAGGVKRHEVEQLMGHRSVRTTSVYTHLFREAFEDVERVLHDIYGAGLRVHERPLASRKRKERRVDARAGNDAYAALLQSVEPRVLAVSSRRPRRASRVAPSDGGLATPPSAASAGPLRLGGGPANPGLSLHLASSKERMWTSEPRSPPRGR